MAAVTLAVVPTWNTTAGDKTCTATPALGDLIVVFAAATGVAGTVGATNVSDNQAGANASTYAKITSSFVGFSTAGGLDVWVRNALITSASATIFTASQAGSTGGGLCVFRVSGMSIVGAAAVRGAGGQSTGTAVTTPAPVLLGRTPSAGGYIFSGTQAGLTTNTCLGTVCNSTNGATTVTQPASWTESSDLGYNTPPTGMENCFRNSGNTASTITFGSTTASAFASLVIELDTSVPQYDWVSPGKADKDANRFLQGAVGRSSTWMQGLRRAKSGILVPEVCW